MEVYNTCMFSSTEQSLTALITKSLEKREHESDEEYFQRVAKSWQQKYTQLTRQVYPLEKQKGETDDHPEEYVCLVMGEVFVSKYRPRVELDIALKPFPSRLEGRLDFVALGGVGFNMSFEPKTPLYPRALSYGCSANTLGNRPVYGWPNVIKQLERVKAQILQVYLSDIHSSDVEALYKEYPHLRPQF